jgi:hypothetical protein
VAGNAGTPLVLNPISTLSAGLAIELPFLMSAATGNPTNRALITNMPFAVIPSSVSPGVSLAQFIPFGAAVPPQAQSPSPLAALPFNLNIPFFDINRFGLPGQGLGTTPTANTGASTPGVGAGGVTQQPLQQAQQIQSMQQLQALQQMQQQQLLQMQQQQLAQFQQQPQQMQQTSINQFQPQQFQQASMFGNQFQPQQFQQASMFGNQFQPQQFQQASMFGNQFQPQQFQQANSMASINPFAFNMGGNGGFNSQAMFANNQSSFSPMSQAFGNNNFGGFPMMSFGPTFGM